MTELIHNYSDIVVGVQVGATFTVLTKYLTDFDLALDFQSESGMLGGRKTEWTVPTGSMLNVALNGYVLPNENPTFSDIFEDEETALFMIYYKNVGRAFVFNAYVNTDGIVRRGGVQQMNQPLIVSGADWTANLLPGDNPQLDGELVDVNTYLFAYLQSAPTGNMAIGEGPDGGAVDIPALTWTSATVAPAIFYHELTAGATRDVTLGAANTSDKTKVLWAIAQNRG